MAPGEFRLAQAGIVLERLEVGTQHAGMGGRTQERCVHPRAQPFALALDAAEGRLERRTAALEVVANALDGGQQQRTLIAKVPVERTVREAGFGSDGARADGAVRQAFGKPCEAVEKPLAAPFGRTSRPIRAWLGRSGRFVRRRNPEIGPARPDFLGCRIPVTLHPVAVGAPSDALDRFVGHRNVLGVSGIMTYPSFIPTLYKTRTEHPSSPP